MTLRMIEVRRILKPTGSVYLHCDNEANAYLRQMMDAVFGHSNFRNEITWKRAPGRSSGNHWGNTIDTIMFYSKTGEYTWHDTRIAKKNTKPTRVPLDAAEIRHGKSGEEWGGYNPTSIGRHWAVPKTGSLAQWITENHILHYAEIEDPHDRLDSLERAGLISWSTNGRPGIMRPPDADQGVKVNDDWRDIKYLSAGAKERTGYPTQKPQALARRIIEASSNPGDIVLDCFAGCAYVPVAAELAERRWLACDMSPRAWTVVRRQFEKHPDLGIETEGERISDMIELKLERAGAVIQVRGPLELPERTTADEPVNAMLPDVAEPVFRQKPLEISRDIWEAFAGHWGPFCWYCGVRTPEDRRSLHLDHIEPRDGTNDDCYNRALACAPCNGDKTDRFAPEQTIDKAFDAGRVDTEARRDELKDQFKARHEWALQRYRDEVRQHRLM